MNYRNVRLNSVAALVLGLLGVAFFALGWVMFGVVGRRESWAFFAVAVFLFLAGFFMVDGGERVPESLDRAPDP
ncbi:hypothetical protein QP866_11925 [Corynebacterium imitans]|uniref:hypothetical protein n=1 Tax=Corynebacterium imitans TaxID=156978 RepID=UPI00254BC68A|nr:hypothetical protein [Corynebacterium imitans]MDK8307413.1 hypothetical protein [Corynebacterium imitans]MDK8638524.1 hypothetical protein [Corynebacterium imitans]MDK8773408.1 hypothetical protein [Corynebacterium imitans]